MKLTASQLVRLAGLDAFAVSGALISAFALFGWFVAPRGVGIDGFELARRYRICEKPTVLPPGSFT